MLVLLIPFLISRERGLRVSKKKKNEVELCSESGSLQSLCKEFYRVCTQGTCTIFKIHFLYKDIQFPVLILSRLSFVMVSWDKQRLRYKPKIVFGNIGDTSWPNKTHPVFSCITSSWKKSLLNSDSKYGANIRFFIAANVDFCSSSSFLGMFFNIVGKEDKEKNRCFSVLCIKKWNW